VIRIFVAELVRVRNSHEFSYNYLRMSDLRYSEVVERLLQVFPQMREPYAAEARRWQPDRPPPHIVYVDLFGPYLRRLVENMSDKDGDEHRSLLHIAFSLIEELSASTDFETRALAETGVLEDLLGEAGGVQRFALFMGPQTKKLARKVADRWRLDSSCLQ
jgi:hypothetical protein